MLPQQVAVAKLDAGAGLSVGGPGGAGYPGDGGDAGQGFAPEPQGSDGFQVGGGGQLAGSVVAEGQFQLVGSDTATVVGNADFGDAALAYRHSDAGCPGVQRVFDQFLDYRGRPLHHLAGGDLSGDVGRQLVDGHGGLVADEAEADQVVFSPLGLPFDDAAQSA